jgi:hypothetical protein
VHCLLDTLSAAGEEALASLTDFTRDSSFVSIPSLFLVNQEAKMRGSSNASSNGPQISGSQIANLEPKELPESLKLQIVFPLRWTTSPYSTN